MDERDWLAERFEEHRTHLRAAAYRMLGSLSEAEDAVQEAWLRLSRTDVGKVENLGGWLTTVVKSENTVPDADLDEQRRVVEAFLAAAREGDFEGLLEMLDPDVVSRADFGREGGSREVRGARAVAGQALFYTRMGLVMRPALVNGAAGGVAIRDGQPFAVGAVTVRGERIVALDFFADPERLRQLDLTRLDS
jgi:ketosteroid isomerase-like protein